MALKSELRHLTNSNSSLGHLKHTQVTTDTAQMLCEAAEKPAHSVNIPNLCM